MSMSDERGMSHESRDTFRLSVALVVDNSALHCGFSSSNLERDGV